MVNGTSAFRGFANKTRIVNVKHRYSEFLGFKMKVFRRADKYVIKSHVGDKQLEHARQKLVTQAKI